MLRLKILTGVIAVSQLILGALTLFAPAPFFLMMGLSAPAPDNQYMLAMLGARFVASGLAFVWLSRQAVPDRRWIRNMVFIQLIDLAAGVYYLAAGIVPLSVAGFPMFNAAAFSLLLWLWQPPKTAKA